MPSLRRICNTIEKLMISIKVIAHLKLLLDLIENVIGSSITRACNMYLKHFYHITPQIVNRLLIINLTIKQIQQCLLFFFMSYLCFIHVKVVRTLVISCTSSNFILMYPSSSRHLNVFFSSVFLIDLRVHPTDTM